MNLLLTANIGLLFGTFIGFAIIGQLNTASMILGIVSGSIALTINITRPLWEKSNG